MIRWRGHVTQKAVKLVRHRLIDVHLFVTFVIFDSDDPDTALYQEQVELQYPGHVFHNLTGAQIRALILDQGVVQPPEELPPGLPVPPLGVDLNVPPDPAPLRQLGARAMQEYLDADAAAVVNPEVFGP